MNKKYYVVDYDYIIGDGGIPKQKLMSTNSGQTIDKILDSYFLDFFLVGTHKDGAYRYYNKDKSQCIAITSWKEVPTEDALILKKYMH